MTTVKTKNLDGIAKKSKPVAARKPYYVAAPKITVTSQKRTVFRHIPAIPARNIYVAMAVVALVAAFTGGMITALRTPKSKAEIETGQKQEASQPIPLNNVQIVSAESGVSGDVLFNTPLQLLQDFLSPKDKPDILAERAAKLKGYLKSRNSPFVDQAELIAKQDHWKLILAISFAESTMGKRCYYNNCSGIGGSNIKTYKSVENWILDFNRLLEKRYKDKTLEQMCGVYVQPCNPNWLLATKQILTELDEKGIE